MSIVRLAKSFVPWVKLGLTAKLKNHELGLLCPGGIGDTYFACALAQAIYQVNQDLSIVAIVKQNHSDIPELFPDSIARKVTFQSRQVVNLASFSRNLTGGKLFFAHPSVRFISQPCQLSMMGFKNLHLLDLYKFTFQLDCKTELSPPKVSQNTLNEARHRIIDYGLPFGQTVILAPDSNTTPSFTEISVDDFWNDLAHRLTEEGYQVVMLTHKNKDFLPQIPRVNFPLIEAIPFVEMCGWAISARSGLCDLLATAKAKLTILYPDRSWYSGTVYSCFSLSLMETSKFVDEIVISNSCQAETIIQQIVSDCAAEERIDTPQLSPST